MRVESISSRVILQVAVAVVAEEAPLLAGQLARLGRRGPAQPGRSALGRPSGAPSGAVGRRRALLDFGAALQPEQPDADQQQGDEGAEHDAVHGRPPSTCARKLAPGEPDPQGEKRAARSARAAAPRPAAAPPPRARRAPRAAAARPTGAAARRGGGRIRPPAARSAPSEMLAARSASAQIRAAAAASSTASTPSSRARQANARPRPSTNSAIAAGVSALGQQRFPARGQRRQSRRIAPVAQRIEHRLAARPLGRRPRQRFAPPGEPQLRRVGLAPAARSSAASRGVSADVASASRRAAGASPSRGG